MNYMQGEPYADTLPSASPQAQNVFDAFDISDTPEPLQEWGTSGASLAVWRREFPAEVSKAIACLPLETLKGWRVTSEVRALETCINTSLSSCGIEDAELKRFLASDMTRVSKIFAASTKSRRLELRLDVIKNDSCRKYHTDNFPERLAVTYHGAGTVAVPHGFADQALSEQEDYFGPEFEISPRWVSLFAGRRPDRNGLVHRSPRISGTKQTRLFFCVNAVRN